ncbi:MAG: penicillin acylase family protein [Pseudomonadota bacterium]
MSFSVFIPANRPGRRPRITATLLNRQRRPLSSLASFALALTLSLPLLNLEATADTLDGDEAALTHYRLEGLEADAEIIVDHWGVPHIYAGTHYDAFFVQGFNAARDRLWQIDTWRRRGLGQLSAVFGPSFVEQDRAARLFLYRGDMYREWLSYGSDAKRIAEAFTAGINAFVALLDSHPELMPPEFELLDYQPARWSAEDVLRIRSNGLWRNVVTEVRRARIACELGLEAAELNRVLQPSWETKIPEGFDPCSLPGDVLDDYTLAKAPVRFETTSGVAKSESRTALIAAVTADDEDGQLGSNNWTVAPERTTTGRPILADDPHRGHAVPSLRYIAHLSAPGLDVIGAGEPALPGISIGHNGTIAFGLTIFPIDQEDLYVYERARLRGRGENRRSAYLYQGRPESVEIIEENIEVRGEAPRSVTLSFTRHGPIVYETSKALYAVRAAWLEPGMAPYFGSVEYMRARNWREFVAALNRWGAPSENQVYADTEGNIGYKPAGLFPRRHNWDGLLPVPGDGRYEWDGFFDMDALPEEYNPTRGFTGTANAMSLPPDFPIAERKVGFEWSAPWRYRRLFEVLYQQDGHSLSDSNALQRDYHSVLAREVIERLPQAAAHPNNPGLAMLKGWDAVLDPDSGPAALYAIWYYKHLQTSLLALALPEERPHIESMDSLAVLEALETDAGVSVALESLTLAWREAGETLGQDPNDWRWGTLHYIAFEHPLLPLADPELAGHMRYPVYPRGGTANTTNSTGFGTDSFAVTRGASFRMVLDVGRWDDAEMTNAPGQSGDPRSPFYDNLLEGWATDSSFPLLYSRDAVEANAALRFKLTPAPVPPPATGRPTAGD